MTTALETASLLSPYAYGRGYPHVDKPGNPGGGAQAVVNVPGSRNFRIMAVKCIFVASAVVANRTIKMVWKDGDGVDWMVVPATANVVASSTTTVTFNAGGGASYVAGDGSLVVSIPDIFVIGGHSVALDVTNFDAGDQFQNIHWYWEEFPIGGHGYPVGVQPAAPAELD